MSHLCVLKVYICPQKRIIPHGCSITWICSHMNMFSHKDYLTWICSHTNVSHDYVFTWICPHMNMSSNECLKWIQRHMNIFQTHIFLTQICPHMNMLWHWWIHVHTRTCPAVNWLPTVFRMAFIICEIKTPTSKIHSHDSRIYSLQITWIFAIVTYM